MEQYTYIEVKNAEGITFCVNRSDGACIPCDPANSDYQRYLNPKAEQSTPIPTE
jgi:hypothetical protein